MRCSALIAAAAALLALAGCGGGGGSKQRAAPGCTPAEHNSQLSAACGYTVTDSLEPASSENVPVPRIREARSRCRLVTEAVFYAAADWMRLARALARGRFACVTYLISIPPVADSDGMYTLPRRGQVERLRALGARFHALAETRVDAWGPWLQRHPGKTWHDAGLEARRRMEAAGYDPRRGETWALNEVMLPVLTDPEARDQTREFVRGLYEGGSGPSRGLVYDVVPFQNDSDVGEYKQQLKRWLEDTPFWAEMERDVRVWADEVYVDAQSCCVAGADLATRAARLNEYLQHRLTLAEAGPASVETARRFLRHAYLPLANGAWEWDFGFGDTELPAAQMERLVSEQVYAMRAFAVARRSREAQSRLGLAWAPRPPTGMPQDAFVAASGRLLGRLATSIHDSGRRGEAAAACGPPGRRTWCSCDVPGSSFAEGWSAFSSWG